MACRLLRAHLGPYIVQYTLRCGTRELRWYMYCRCHTYCGCDCKSPMSDLSAVPHAGLPNEGFSGMHPRESMLRTPKHLNRLRYRQNSPHQGSGSLLMASIASLISLADGGQTVWRQIPHSTRSGKLSRQWRRNWEATQPTVSYQGIDGGSLLMELDAGRFQPTERTAVSNANPHKCQRLYNPLGM